MQLTTHIAWPLISTACFGAFAAVVANVVSFIMIGKINKRMQERD